MRIQANAVCHGVSEWSGLFISSLELCTTVVIRSAVTDPGTSHVLMCGTEVPCRRYTWYPTQSL